MVRCCIFPIFLANSDQEAIQFDPSFHGFYILFFQGSKTNFYLKAHLFFSVQKVIRKIVWGSIRFDPYCSFKELIETSTEAHVFFGVQTFIKKQYLRHYGLTHILLSFQGSYYKFPPKTHMFLVFKNPFKKFLSGTIWFDLLSFQGSL